MLSVQLHFIIDCFLVSNKLVIAEPVIFSILGDSEMFDIRNFFTLADQEVRCIRLFSKENIILV